MINLPINPDKQEQMASYMRNRFPFNGIEATKRHEIEREVWQQIKKLPVEDLFNEIKNYYNCDAHEYQYLAIDLAVRAKRKWDHNYLLKLLQLSQEKMWWDSIDVWRKVFAEYIKLHPEEFLWVSSLFKNHEIFWMRRIGIILQLGFKNKTDINYLSEMILADIDTDEFFIQKAIGWSLREYAKTDQTWAETFVSENNLSNLARSEALKHIK